MTKKPKPEGAKSAERPSGERFNRAVDRLVAEVRGIRTDWAALRAARGKVSSNLFLLGAVSAYHSDARIRLMRVFDTHPDATSFWYLLRCDPARVGRGIDISMLCSFSNRIKLIRDKVFVHIDKKAVSDPQGVYAEANISVAPDNDEVAVAIDTAWNVLKQLYFEIHGKKVEHSGAKALEQLTQDFERDLKKLIGTE